MTAGKSALRPVTRGWAASLVSVQRGSDRARGGSVQDAAAARANGGGTR
jgi:hypothetical protein